MALTSDVGVSVLSGSDPQKQIESVVKQVNENFRIISNEDRTKIIKDDAGVQRLLTGYQDGGFNNGNVGIKLSKVGFDVTTAARDELIFSSDNNTFNIYTTLTGNFTTGSLTSNSTQVQTNLVTIIPHGLDYIPAFLAYVQLSGSTYCLMPYTTTDIFGSTINNYATRSYSVTANATNIFVTLQVTQCSTSSTTVSYGGEPVKVYILTETAN